MIMISRRTPHRAPALLGAWLSGACVLLGLSGCGQKGSLFLPDHKPEAVPTVPAPATPEVPAETPATRKAPRAPDPATAR